MQHILKVTLLMVYIFEGNCAEIFACAGYDNIVVISNASTSGNQSNICWHENEDILHCSSITQGLVDTLHNSTCIVLSNNQKLNESVKFTNMDKLLIASERGSTQLTCSNGQVPSIGIEFLNSKNIVISNVSFVNCGKRNSWTYHHYSVLASCLFFDNCSNITMTGVKSRSSMGYFAAFIDVHDRIFLSNLISKFGKRVLISPKNYALQGVLFFGYTALYHGEDNLVHITGCTFINQAAPYVEKDLAGENLFLKGGAINVYSEGSLVNSRFIVDDESVFDGNQALYGGAIFILLKQNSIGNVFNFTNSRFIANRAKASGGAVYLTDAFDVFNMFFFTNLYFKRNLGQQGGGLSFVTYSNANLNIPSHKVFLHDPVEGGSNVLGKINMLDCRFHENNALLGAAIHLQNVKAAITNVNITEENILPGYHSRGNGAFYAYNSSIFFYGADHFERNNNTALVLDCSKVYALSKLYFSFNHGFDGGAIAMYGHSLIYVQSTTVISFKNNVASNKGGALFVEIPGPPLKPFNSTEQKIYPCFFWNEDSLDGSFNSFSGSVEFINNSAHDNYGSSIFASSLQNCLQPSDENNLLKVLTSWNNFSFQPADAKRSIITHAIKLKLNESDWNVVPGKIFDATVTLTDERGNNVEGTINVNLSFAVSVETNPTFAVESVNKIKLSLLGEQGTHFNVTVTSTKGVSDTKTVNGTLLFCPFGMKFGGDKNTSQKCVCDVVKNTEKGIAECSTQLYLFRDRWVPPDQYGGFKPEKKVSHLCPHGYCSYCDHNHSTSIHCLYQRNNQCAHSRKQDSRLCSQCHGDLSVVIGGAHCKACRGSNNCILISFLIILGLTVFILFLMFLNLDIHCHFINGCLYSYQVIDLLYTPGQKVDEFIFIVIGIAEFTLKNTAYPSSCLWHGLNDLQKMAYHYIIPGWLFVCMIIMFLWARIKPNRIVCKDRCLKAFTIVGFMIYADFTRISFWLIAKVDIKSNSYVYIYAKATYLGTEHLPYAVVAILFMIFFSFGIPLLLLCSPLFKHNQFNLLTPTVLFLQSVIGAFSCRLRPKRMWFLPYYYINRMIIFALGVFFPSDPSQYVLLTLICLIAFISFCLIQPYNDAKENIVEALLLANLVVVSLLGLGAETVYEPKTEKIYKYIVHFLTYVPFIVMVTSVVYQLLMKQSIFCRNRSLIQGKRVASVPYRAVELHHDYQEYTD